jgi:hypothetical protein
MELIISIIVLVVGYNLYKASIENKLDNYDHHKIDFVKLHEDKVSNHLSDLDLHRNIVNGKYDK